jgi:hypothetical protein
MTSIDLKKIRESATRRNEDGKPKIISRADLAASMTQVLGRPVHETQLARYEDDGDSIPFDMLMAWLRCLDTTLEEQMKQQAPLDKWQGLNAGEPHQKLHTRLALLLEYLDAGETHLEHAGAGVSSGIKTLIERLQRKPNVALMGAFDAGKSTLVNWLLGEDNLPTRYQPATAVVTFVRHLQDKPTDLAEDVVLLDESFDPAQWNNLEHISEHKIIAGGLGTLRRYGMNETDTASLRAKPEFALVFLDSPVLHSCNLIDNPGLENNDDDSTKAYRTFAYMDVLIYASTATGFMNGADIAVLKECIKNLPPHDRKGSPLVPLGHLFIVATHAAPHIDDQIEEICNSAARRLYRELNEYHLPARQEISARVIDEYLLRNRIFSFWKESPKRCESIANNLTALLENQLPVVWWNNSDTAIEAMKKNTKTKISRQIRNLEKALQDTEGARALYKQKASEITAIEEQTSKSRQKLHDAVAIYQAETINNFDSAYKELMQPEPLIELIKKRYPGDGKDSKRDAQQNIGSHLIDILQDVITKSCAERLEKLGPILEEHMNFYENLSDTSSDRIEIPFDAHGAFVGGMAGLGTAGALALMSAVAGNLGGYVLVAHGLGFLSSIGISLGSASGVMSAVSAIGGPITLGLAIAAAAFFFGKSFFGEKWQSLLAKQIIKQFSDTNTDKKLKKSIKSVWNKVLKNFDAGSHKLHEQYEAHINEMGEKLAEGPEKRQEIEQLVSAYKQAQDFFVRMPWF